MAPVGPRKRRNEFTSTAVPAFTQELKLDRRHIAPGKPALAHASIRCRAADATHAMAESFQGRMRDDCLDEHLSFSMNHARAVIAAWRTDFNTARPHSSLGYMTPAAFAAALKPQWPSALRSTEGSPPMAIVHAAQTRKSQTTIPVASG